MTDKNQNDVNELKQEKKVLTGKPSKALPKEQSKKYQRHLEIEAKKKSLHIGRPSKYDPSFVQIALDISKRGGSLAAVCSELMVPRETLYKWAEAHKEFADCLSLCRELMQNYMENQAVTHSIENKDGPKLNTTLWNFRSKHLFKDYREQAPNIIINTEKAPENPELATEIKDKLSELESKIRDKR